jgi:hypothetical protein
MSTEEQWFETHYFTDPLTLGSVLAWIISFTAVDYTYLGWLVSIHVRIAIEIEQWMISFHKGLCLSQ